MLAMTLITVLTGLCVAAPAVGIPWAIFSVPAWILASQARRFNSKNNNRQALPNKLLDIFGSTGVVILIFAASGAAGFTACSFIGSLSEMDRSEGMWWGIALFACIPLGLVVVVTTFVWLMRKFFPKPNRRT